MWRHEALVLKTFGRVIVMPKAAADVNKMVQFLSHLGYKVEKVHNWTRSRTDADLGEKASGRASESRG